MNNSHFDYILFSINLKSQAYQDIPSDIAEKDKLYVVSTIEEYVQIAGKALEADSIDYSEQQFKLSCQVIAEWTFHKAIDIILAEIPPKWRDGLLQRIAFTVFEVTKQAYEKSCNNDELLNAVEYHVNKAYKSGLEQLLDNNEISQDLYNNALAYSNIDEMSKNKTKSHDEFYSIDENKDNKYLNDKVLEVYGRTLVYRYLIKAARVLKKHKCEAEDRRNVLYFLHLGTHYIIDCVTCTMDKYSNEQMLRLITVSMELLFHRIVVLYKHNILRIEDDSESLINYFASLIYSIEIKYIKDNDKLKDTYDYTNTFSNSSLKQYLKDWLNKGSITQEQYNKVLDKSYMVYLENEICHLMGVKKIPKTIMMTCVILVAWLILKIIVYFFWDH